MINRPQPERVPTTVHVVAIFVVLALLAVQIVSADHAAAKRAREQSESTLHMRAQYTKTGFCPYCNGPHWLPGLPPKPCPICNPRGSLEVRD